MFRAALRTVSPPHWSRLKKPRAMTNHHHTPRRSVRVPEDLWQAALVRSQEKGETVTDVLVRALKRYVR
jgi:hypothetical protein